MKSLGHTQSEIEDISEACSYEEVAEALLRLQAAEDRMRQKGQHISSKKSYFNGILSNIALGSGDDDMDHEKIEAEARAQAAHRAAQERQERLKLEFERHQALTFAGNLFSVEEGQRNSWLRSFEQSPDGTKAQLLLRRGWDASNTGALSLLKTWLSRNQPAVLDAKLPNPEDKSLEAWMAWRLDQAH